MLEPAQAAPVIIEDEAFVGSRSMITQGAQVGEGAVLGEGVNATRSKELPGGTFGLPCVLILKRLTEGERYDKGRLNDALRAHGIAI